MWHKYFSVAYISSTVCSQIFSPGTKLIQVIFCLGRKPGLVTITLCAKNFGETNDKHNNANGDMPWKTLIVSPYHKICNQHPAHSFWGVGRKLAISQFNENFPRSYVVSGW